VTATSFMVRDKAHAPQTAELVGKRTSLHRMAYMREWLIINSANIRFTKEISK